MISCFFSSERFSSNSRFRTFFSSSVSNERNVESLCFSRRISLKISAFFSGVSKEMKISAFFSSVRSWLKISSFSACVSSLGTWLLLPAAGSLMPLTASRSNMLSQPVIARTVKTRITLKTFFIVFLSIFFN